MSTEIAEILELHVKWLSKKHGGVRANLSRADLSSANLTDANLSRADLRWANLRNAVFSYDVPVVTNIHTKMYEAVSIPNALDMNMWHTCETTHCRAGWAIVLAGAKGKQLESEIGTNAAAALIYMASDPTLEHVPDWFALNEEALADIRRLAQV